MITVEAISERGRPCLRVCAPYMNFPALSGLSHLVENYSDVTGVGWELVDGRYDTINVFPRTAQGVVEVIGMLGRYAPENRTRAQVVNTKGEPLNPSDISAIQQPFADAQSKGASDIGRS
jgi:hypothetical protein